MRQFFFMLMLAAMTSVSAQTQMNEWIEVPVVDEFGDDTGAAADIYISEGTFSNSATSGSDLLVRVSNQNGSYFIELFEYGTQPSAALTLSSAYGDIRVKRESGEVETYRGFASKSGGIYFADDSKLANLLDQSSGEKLRVVVDEDDFSDYGSSRYVFTVHCKKP
jgi:hypothetical protein